VDDLLQQGWELLQSGQVDEARKIGDRLVVADPNSPEAHTLVGAVAHVEGDVETAQAELKKAMELDPEYLEPILLAAETAALDGDLANARQLAARALTIAEEEDEYVEALLLKADIELGDEDEDAARATLSELPPVSLPTSELELRAAELFFELEDYDRAESRYAAAAAQDPQLADAEYGLGLVAQARGKREEMIAHFLRVRALDAATPPAPWSVSTAQLEGWIESALGELPEAAQKLLANVPIVVELWPAEEVVADGFDPRALGLFAGLPYPEHAALGGQPPHLECVFLYQRNIERVARRAEEVEQEIRTTLLHETGHFFGLDEDELANRGLD
jgi:predicted Zn-dependent protease with MMP-like domain